eukprot:Nk52_evm1s2342 gene=Nk52_evmTU1s2342
MKMETPPGSELWIFGYGSLVWNPNIPYEESVAGYVKGFVRRFWQGSTDHRGVPGAPGRVCTLAEDPEGITWGMAFRVAREKEKEVLEYLDYREKGGFSKHLLEVHPKDAKAYAGREIKALCYVGTPENEEYLGPAAMEDMAELIAFSVGPSGKNCDYLFHLADYMREFLGDESEDEHLFGLDRLVREKIAKREKVLEEARKE